MTPADTIERFRLFFDGKPLKSPVMVDVMELAKYDSELAEELLDKPEETISSAQIAIEKEEAAPDNPEVHILNTPESSKREINNIRTKDIEKLLCVEGVVVSRSKVLTKLKSMKFECPSCGNITNILQSDNHIKEPTRCGCGRKGKFHHISSIKSDWVYFKMEELPENLRGGQQPQSLFTYAEGVLTESEKHIIMGGRVKVIGILKQSSIYDRGKRRTVCDFTLEVKGIEFLEIGQVNEEISKEEMALFHDIAKAKNPARMIANFILPDIWGLRKIKEAVIYQLFSGGMFEGRRDFMHILLLGDPGTAKTDLAYRIHRLHPIHKMSTGPGLSAVGLTASVVKDEYSGQYVLAGGLLPRANGGIAFVDELEKANPEHLNSLHTALEAGFCAINKANICAKVVANTRFLATSNPKVVGNGRNLVENSGLPLAILDRFDLIYILKDTIDTNKDHQVATIISERAAKKQETVTTNKDNSTRYGENLTSFEHSGTTFTDYTINKYIQYIQQHYKKPVLSRRVVLQLSGFYKRLRQMSTYAGFEQKKPTPRVVESILRMARAIARARMKETVDTKILKEAISYFDFMFKSDGSPQHVEEEIIQDRPTKQQRIQTAAPPKHTDQDDDDIDFSDDDDDEIE